MRATLSDARLARYAGQFVWLELDFDKTVNREFLKEHRAMYTPTLFVIDPTDGHALATQLGGLTVDELAAFLDRGARAMKGNPLAPADASLARGDSLLGRGNAREAADAYGEALRKAPAGWASRDRAIAARVWALMTAHEYRASSELAAAEAPRMARAELFARVVLAGLSSTASGGNVRWAADAQRTLEPLAAEAVALPSTLRDHRFSLYQLLMECARNRNDRKALARWGDLWLHELDTTKPTSDDERSALDIARVDAATLLGDASRVLPALRASEKAMPGNYNASLRLAQMFELAKRYGDAIAACDRGLAHVTGPLGRSWLLQTKSDVLAAKGDRQDARLILEEALRSARTIVEQNLRENNVNRIEAKLKEL